MTDCPINFKQLQRIPRLLDNLDVRSQQYDTVDETGLAMIDLNGQFCGWIVKVDKKRVLSYILL